MLEASLWDFPVFLLLRSHCSTIWYKLCHLYSPEENSSLNLHFPAISEFSCISKSIKELQLVKLERRLCNLQERLVIKISISQWAQVRVKIWRKCQFSPAILKQLLYDKITWDRSHWSRYLLPLPLPSPIPPSGHSHKRKQMNEKNDDRRSSYNCMFAYLRNLKHKLEH